MTSSKGEEPKAREPIVPAFANEHLIIFRCEDLFYPEYKGKFFILQKSDGYEYFYEMYEKYTRGQVVDQFGIILPKDSRRIVRPQEQEWITDSPKPDFEDRATNYWYEENNVKAGVQLQKDAWNDAIDLITSYIRRKNLVQVEEIELLKIKP